MNYIYIDGVLSNSWNMSSIYTSNFSCLLGSSYNRFSVGRSYGTTTTYTGGLINDVRAYDHALSPKEVEEISKGLVLHYKLDDGYIESTTNLLSYPTPGSACSPGWDSALHPNAISTSYWGSGYNGGVTSPSTGYHAMWNLIDDIPTIVYQNHNSEISQTNRWLGMSSSVSGATAITAGTKYTISWD